MSRQQIPLVGEMNPTTNHLLVNSFQWYENGYFEIFKDAISNTRKTFFIKRPGVVLGALYSPTWGGSNPGVLGYCQLDEQSSVIYTTGDSSAGTQAAWFGNTNVTPGWMVGTKFAGGCHIIALTSGTSNTIYGANNFAAATDGNNGALISAAGAWVEMTNANYVAIPTNRTNFVALDGYLFQGEPTNSRIYNSDLNNATNWTSTSFIAANDYPGQLYWLERLRSYVIAFKQNSVEFFEDQGNPIPGSPLGSVKSLNRSIGLVDRNSVKAVSDGIIFLGRTPNGGRTFYKIDRDSLKVSAIDFPFPEIYVSNYPESNSSFADQNASCFVLNYRDKEFYCYRVSTGGLPQTMLVYDNKLSIWMIWSNGTTSYYPFLFGQPIYYNNGTSRDAYLSQPRLATTWQKLSDSIYQDNFISVYNDFTFKWVSDKYDFGTQAWKFMDSFEVIYNIGPGVVSTPSINLIYYDDDAVTPTATKTKTLNIGASLRAIFRRLSRFRRRYFVISSTSNTPMSINAIEVQYNSTDLED